MASAAAVTEDASAEPVNYKTCVLRVSIHCEGCKKKVKKILKKIHGVEDIIIDSKIHKVTVIGNVNGEALLRKLLIKGKHAEFWPSPPSPPQKITQTKEKKQETLKSDEIKKDQQPQINKDGNSGEPEQQNQSKPEEEKIQVKVKNIPINGETSNDNSNKSANEGVQAEKGVNGPTQEAKGEGKLPANASPVNPTPATDNTGIENGVAAGTDKAVGSGIVRKKKGKKGQKSSETSETVQISGDTARSIELSSHPASQATESVYRVPSSRQHANPYPSYDTPPTCVMSYNTANPSSSYSETYYAQPPTYTYSQPPPPYMHAQPPPPSFVYSDSPPRQHPQQQSDSFTMFSDENANGCSIM
ncbi:hypothetical protein C5167_043355 [Papaver somniferum]|uniref:HMA domain-containing protein n=1 Tax=Papaver somniferum TaxID=3469 RepID=A0A4Y7L6G4_PAPSO|nr:heavy metal-associated isoprenylated plant protein 35-like [Papaver somniferum]RZC80786.1 hypothetical protein C5167_043355 [Papaver somniferum]